MLHPRPALGRLLALATLVLPVTADVLILEDPGAGLFTSLQAAVDAAQDGATLVLGAEALEGCLIDGKGLTLVGPAGGGALLVGTLEVRNLSPAQALRVSHLTVAPEATDLYRPGLLVEDCQGPIRLSACRLEGASGLSGDPDFLTDGWPAAVLLRSDQVAFLDCQLFGGQGGFTENRFAGSGGDGGVGLRAMESSVALDHCLVQGGQGGTAGTYGGEGGSGAGSVDSLLFAAGGSFRGGPGGDATDFLVAIAGDGGDGFVAVGSPRPRFLQCTFVGGSGGDTFGGSDGQAGVARVWDQGPLVDLPGRSRALRALLPAAQVGADLSLEVEGFAGDRFFVTAALQDDFALRAFPAGVRLTPKPSVFPTQPQATLAQDGSQALSLQAPPVPFGQSNATWVLQAWVRNAQGHTALAGACLVTSVSPAAAGADCDGNGTGDLLDVLSGAVDVDGDLQPDDCGSAFDFFVDPAVAAGGQGSLSSPFGSLAEAFALVPSGATLHLVDGTYSGPLNRDLDPAGRELTLRALGGPDSCVVNLGGQGSLVSSSQGASLPVTLDGLQVRNGAGGDAGDGGAVYLPAQPLRVLGCRFSSCVASGSGGALLLAPGSYLADSTFVENRADGIGTDQGGGAISALGQLWVLRCTFDDNQARAGGAVRLPSAACQDTSVLSHSVFRLNTASERGGAVDVVGCEQGLLTEVILDDCFLSKNDAPLGGALCLQAFGNGERLDLRLVQCTLVDNSAAPVAGTLEGGGAVAVLGYSTAYLQNTIVWGNQAAEGTQFLLQGDGPGLSQKAGLLSFYSLVEGGPAEVFEVFGDVSWLAGSLDLDPLFVAPPLDYRLSAASPALDAGNDLAVGFDTLDVDGDGFTTERVGLDLLGLPRQVDDPAPDTGSGSAPLPDLGAFERQP